MKKIGIKITFSVVSTTILLILFSHSAHPASTGPKESTPDDIRMQDSLAFELCQIYGIDQAVRNPQKHHIYNQLGEAYDSIAFDRMIDFIYRHGYPRKGLVGESNYSFECVAAAAFATLSHMPSRLIEPEVYTILKN